MNAHEQAVAWARTVLEDDAAIILDTETTGLHTDAEIVQIGILSVTGQVVLDTLVRPTRCIPIEAQRIHGISDSMVLDAPTLKDLVPRLHDILSGARVVIYNARYDLRLLAQSMRAHDLPHEVPLFGAQFDCAMEWYGQWVGEWSPLRGYKWQRLPGGDHTAIGDCRATLAVLKRMTGDQT